MGAKRSPEQVQEIAGATSFSEMKQGKYEHGFSGSGTFKQDCKCYISRAPQKLPIRLCRCLCQVVEKTTHLIIILVYFFYLPAPSSPSYEREGFRVAINDA